MNFFSEYKNLKIESCGAGYYFVTNESHEIVLEFIFNGLEYDVCFGSGAYNQAFLTEALRMLGFLNNGGEL